MKYRSPLFYLSLLAAGLFSCGSPDSGNAGKAKVFKYNEIAGITSLDPAAANNLENIWAINQIFNGLVELDDSMRVRPSIAKRWEVYDDGLEYTFYLRKDVFFHDHPLFPEGKGRRVVASDFVRSFQRLREHKSEHSSRFFFKLLDLNDENNNLGCSAPNDTTFRIFLKTPFPPLLEVLTMQYFVVVPVEIADQLGEEFRFKPVGTGPFRFKIWDEGSKLVLVKNEQYFEYENGNRLPYLDGVAITFVRDKESLMTEFFAGRLDMISGADAMNLNLVLDRNGEMKPELKDSFLMQKSPFLKTDYLGFLVDPALDIVKESPIKNKWVRQAMNYAIDRESLVKQLRHNIGYPARAGFVPRGMPSYNENKVKGYTYDPDKARKLLAKAGYPGGKGLEEIILHITPNHLKLSEFIEKQLEDVGFKVKINVNQPIVQREDIESSRILFFRKTWVADYASPENFLSVFYGKNFSPNGPNYFHFRNEAFDKIYQWALKEQDEMQRLSFYQQMDNIILEEAVVIPLYYDEVLRFVQKGVEGLSTNPMNLLNLKRVKKS
jgi:oligopeptide transport system substrate-binding protein